MFLQYFLIKCSKNSKPFQKLAMVTIETNMVTMFSSISENNTLQQNKGSTNYICTEFLSTTSTIKQTALTLNMISLSDTNLNNSPDCTKSVSVVLQYVSCSLTLQFSLSYTCCTVRISLLLFYLLFQCASANSGTTMLQTVMQVTYFCAHPF